MNVGDVIQGPLITEKGTMVSEEANQVVFRVQGERAILARTPSLLSLAGSVPVPAEKRGIRWEEVRRQTRAARARTRR